MPSCPAARQRRADADADFAAQFAISSEGGLHERSPRGAPTPPCRERSRSRSPPHAGFPTGRSCAQAGAAGGAGPDAPP
eukprot:2268802-Alexandrium_andersonii.AAC.1